MGESEDHEDKPSNTLEYFIEHDTVKEMIENLKAEHDTTFEKSYEVFSEILAKYQEQPHLLNPHLQNLIELLLAYIRDQNTEATVFHAAFKYMYQFAKVRTYKVFVKYLPHEISDLQFVIKSLEEQRADDSTHWETRYMLILWLSILVLNPFEMSRFDTGDASPENSIKERIFDICRLNSANNDTCSDVAAFLTSKYLIRIDIKDKYLPKYLNWVMETEEAIQFGQLAAISATLKYGKRDDLLPYSTILLKWLLAGDYKSENDFLKNKYFIKIIQRVGLILLKPRLALWRYQRGSRSLAANLSASVVVGGDIEFQSAKLVDGERDEEVVVPDQIEDVIEELLQGLRNASSDIRWSAAKGIGRVTNRLPKEFGDEVVGSVIEILSPMEPNEAWHGACLAIAELAKRGLLLPYRLETMVPLLLQALIYDELKGYMSVGQHIRDAACYMCWAFARAYEPAILKPFVNRIAAGLLVTTVFDREINCRRAASAAFQENVGRLRTFPHGIDILTKADFFSVGIRTHSFLDISDYIAQYNDYSFHLIDHLVARKVNHWDTAIRELTAKTLHKLTAREPDYMVQEVLPKLFEQTTSIDVNARHGCVLAIGEIISKLKSLNVEENESNGKYTITNELNERLNNLISSFQKRDQYKGLSGEMMFQCSCDYIRNCSSAKIYATDECLASWQSVVDACLIKNSTPLHESAITALGELCQTYYDKPERIGENQKILENYLTGSKEDLWEFVRMGYTSAVGALPKFMVMPKLREIFIVLMAHSLTPTDRKEFFDDESLTEESQTVNNWSEARRDSVKALSNVIQAVGFDELAKTHISFIGDKSILEKCFECLLKALQEYTIDNRGDIGAWVREAAMNALFKMITCCPHHLLSPDIVHAILCGFVQQAVEKIDRTRALAGKLFCKAIYSDPAIPYIQHHEFIKTVFPEDSENILWLHAAHTFPLFCALLEKPEYTEALLIGLIASVGQLTESLIKHSSTSLCQFLRSHPDHKVRICNVIVDIFKNNILNERITCPLLNFLNTVISSGTIDSIVLDSNSPFSSEIYRLTKLEIKGHKKLYKLVSSINVFCQLIQVPELTARVLSSLSVFLGLPHVHVRKCTATKLYEALILHADVCGIPDEKLDDILNCLSETDWAQPVTEIRPIRNNLCVALGIKPPMTVNPAK